MIRVMLQAEHFRALVVGETVRLSGVAPADLVDVEIALVDVGFGVMRQAVADAERVAQARSVTRRDGDPGQTHYLGDSCAGGHR